MTDSGGMFSKLINPNTAKPAESQKSVSKIEASSTPLPAKPKAHPHKAKRQVKPTQQPTSQSTNQSISQPTSRPFSKIVDRPKAFYITEALDEKLDQAVNYLQKKHGIKKVDRSVLVNALLDNDTFWTDQALDQLVDKVVGQLTSRLISR
jgi:uncharacterized protein YkwD